MTNSLDMSRDLSNDRRLYGLLRNELKRAGILRPALLASAIHMLFVLGVYFGAYFALLQNPSWGLKIGLLVLLAIASVQSAYIAHEVGHYAIVRSKTVVRILGHIFLTFITGYAQTQYQQKHRAHHGHPNEAGVDPDIEIAGLVTIYESSALQKKGLARLVTVAQAYLIWPIVSLTAFAAKKDSIKKYLIAPPGQHPEEQIVLTAHYGFWFGPPVAILGFSEALLNYSIVAWIMGAYLGIAILVNHIGMPILESNLRRSLLHRTIATTRDLGTSRFCDYFFGGTNNHVEHHLFPSIPIYRLGAARKITQNFCVRHGLPHVQVTWLRAMRDVFEYLVDMSMRARQVWDGQVTKSILVSHVKLNNQVSLNKLT